jgi:outer membrane protein assembly factor BamB
VTGAGLNGTGPDNDEVHAERPEPTMKVRDLPKRSQSDRTGSNSGREARPGSTREPSRNPETEPDSAERGDPVESENDGVGGQEIDETEAEDRLYPPEQTETGITPGENVDSGGTDTNVAGSSVDGLDLGHDDGGDDPSSDRRTETGRDPLSNTTDRSTTGTATPESAPDVIPTGGDEPIEVVGGSERIGQSFDAGKGENRGANARTAPGDETEVDREREVGIGTSSGRRARAVGFPQFRYDAANTGDVGSDVRTIRAPTQRWDPVVLEEECTATPVIRDDYLVVGTRKGRLHAISLVDGGHEQVATTDGALVASPALVDDHVVVVTTDGAVAGYRVGTDGDQLVARESWRYGDRVGRNTTTASPTVAGCRVFVAGEDGAVHAIDGDTGDAVWDGPYEAGASVMLSAPAVVDGTVYVTTKAGRLHAIDAATGAERWTESLGSAQVLASPAVVNGRLLVGDCRGTLSVVDVSEGSVVRTVAIGDEILSSAAVRDGTAYVAGNVGGRISERTDRSLDVETERARSERAVVTALDTTAGFDRRWTRELDAVTIASPTIVGDGLFVGTSGGRLFGLDRRSGEPLWDSPVGFDAGIESSVAAAGGGLYVPDHDGTVRSVVDRHD